MKAFGRFGKGLLLLQVNSAGTVLLPAPSCGQSPRTPPGTSAAPSSSSTASSNQHEVNRESWIEIKEWFGITVIASPREGPLEKSISETVPVSKIDRTGMNQMQSVLTGYVFPRTLIGLGILCIGGRFCDACYRFPLSKICKVPLISVP